MQNGLYVATSGLLMQEERLNVISNNMANINTNGFKKELALFTNYRPKDPRIPQEQIKQTLYNKTINASVMLDDIVTNFEQGHLRPTENKFDLAIEDINHFFTVETPWGARYTRDGEFTLDENGELVTRDGFNLLDRNTLAPITIPPNATNLIIDNKGGVYIDNAQIAEIDIANFPEKEKLQKIGRNLYAAVNITPEKPTTPKIRQGFIESSNVSPITEMVQMITALRGFEMYQKAVHTYDTMNEQVNSIARL